MENVNEPLDLSVNSNNNNNHNYDQVEPLDLSVKNNNNQNYDQVEPLDLSVNRDNNEMVEDHNEMEDNDSLNLEIRENAFERRIRTIAIVNKTHIDVTQFLKDTYSLYKSEVLKMIDEHYITKTKACFIAEFEKNVSNAGINNSNSSGSSDTGEDVLIKQRFVFWTEEVIIKTIEEFTEEFFNEHFVEKIASDVETMAIEGSGFTLSKIIELIAHFYAYEPIAGSSYIETPSFLKKKKAIVNVDNSKLRPIDNMCFKWAVLSAIHEVSYNPSRIQHYLPFQNELNFDGINFPVQINQIDKFEKQNDNISINVYYYNYEDKNVQPIRLSNNIKDRHIHLLIITAKKRDGVIIRNTLGTSAKVRMSLINSNCSVNMHYCWIKNLSRLISTQQTNSGHRIYICDRCLNFFHKDTQLVEHRNYCVNECYIKMPNDDTKWIHFKNYKYGLKAPFIVYADTESYLKPLNTDERKQVFNESCATTVYQSHQIFSIAYYLKCDYDDSLSFYASSPDPANCVKWFLKELQIIAEIVERELLNIRSPDPLTVEEEQILNDPNAKCFICNKNFEQNEIRCREHCHLSKKIRG